MNLLYKNHRQYWCSIATFVLASRVSPTETNILHIILFFLLPSCAKSSIIYFTFLANLISSDMSRLPVGIFFWWIAVYLQGKEFAYRPAKSTEYSSTIFSHLSRSMYVGYSHVNIYLKYNENVRDGDRKFYMNPLSSPQRGTRLILTPKSSSSPKAG